MTLDQIAQPLTSLLCGTCSCIAKLCRAVDHETHPVESKPNQTCPRGRGDTISLIACSDGGHVAQKRASERMVGPKEGW